MEQPLAIEVRGVSKHFRIPEEHVSLRRRLRHPLNPPARILEVLEDISFEVKKGEFFGVIGRNGSGKSTLLKLLASVYRADAGRIRMAGRLAPFLELGVGFNAQLAARDNVILNAVMMGLSQDQATGIVDEVIDFAGLQDFTDMRLKNYSSGMKVRLAFAVLTQVDADVLLLDEVLAVGDTEFQEKCEAQFLRMREEGRTIVLVTHSMPTVNAFCDRALLIHDGRIKSIGSPVEVSNQYLEINLRAAAASRGSDEVGAYAEQFAAVLADPPVHIIEAWLEDSKGERTTVITESEPIEIRVVADVTRAIDRPGFQFRIEDMRGQILFAGGSADLEQGDVAQPGQRLRLRGTVENRLSAGRYVCAGAVAQRVEDGSSQPATPVTTLNFEVTGESSEGPLRLDHKVSLEVEQSDEPALR